jgi:hypothetical protein
MLPNPFLQTHFELAWLMPLSKHCSFFSGYLAFLFAGVLFLTVERWSATLVSNPVKLQHPLLQIHFEHAWLMLHEITSLTGSGQLNLLTVPVSS